MYEPSDATEAFSLPVNRLHSLKIRALTYFPWTLQRAKFLWQNSCVPNLHTTYFQMPLMSHTGEERMVDPKADNQTSRLL